MPPDYMENQPKPSSPDEKDIDLGVLFILFVRIANKILSIFRSLIRLVLSVLIWILLFIRRKIVYLLLGMALGLLPGLLGYWLKGTKYSSAMTVRVNFGSAHNLYNKIDYFNSLIKMGENKKLAQLFHTTEAYAGQLMRFDIAPVDDQLQAAELYKKNFYDPADFSRVMKEGQLMLTRDSAWSQLIKFKDFKDKLKDYDYPMQEVTLYSRAPSGYGNIQAALVAAVSENSALQLQRQIADSLHKEQAGIIRSSLANSDSLMHAFSRSIAAGSKPEGSTLTLSTRLPKNPEVEIFDETIKLKDELRRSQKDEADNHDIVQVYADFNDTGMPISPIKESFLDYSLWFLLATFVILLILEAYTEIDAAEKKKQHA
jgi:hypothetical protein